MSSKQGGEVAVQGSKRFPYEWEQFPTKRQQLATSLATAIITSCALGRVDANVVQALYGTKLKKRRHHKHDPMTLITQPIVDDNFINAVKCWRPLNRPNGPEGLSGDATTEDIMEMVTYLEEKFDWLQPCIEAVKWCVTPLWPAFELDTTSSTGLSSHTRWLPVTTHP